MKDEILNSGEFVFRPRARLIKTIGEELISNDNVAITELVKNSYDAESPIVDITISGVVKEKKVTKRIGRKESTVNEYYIDKDKATIIIYDQGKGMDFDTIQHAWMEPATNFKKKEENKSIKRKFSGEKGIGRFASAKLSSKLELVTKQKNKDEIVVKFDWNDFSNEEAYLDNVKVNWFVRPATLIKNSGTILKLTGLNDDWDEDKIRELRIALSRLLNPITPNEDFLISINLPEAFGENLSGLIERPETLNRPNYFIKGKITKDGNPSNFIFYSKKTGKEETFDIAKDLFRLKRSYSAGPFSFEFKIWDRDTDNLNNLANETNAIVKDVKKDLDDLCGISIYRDNVRVLPYGNQNNDWVRLDLRRVNNPTLRLSNNQIVGYISIGLDTNPALRDQSNREGIVESQAFEDLKEYIKLILNEVEQRRYNERPRENQTEARTGVGLFEKFSLNALTDALKERIPNNTEVIALVEQKNNEIKDAILKVQEIISRYRRLSTLGQLIDTILHDGHGFLNKIDLNAHLIEKVVKKNEIDKSKLLSLVDSLQNIRAEFAQLFKRIAPFGGRKRGRPKKIVIEDVIKNQFYMYQSELSRLNITVCVPSSTHEATMDEAELGIIFMNLIQNSIYWLETIDSERRIDVNIYNEDDGLCILFSDTGPGIKNGTEQNIFEPYFSTKPDGIGLGLTIVGELVSEYNGELMLVDNNTSNGACFKIKLRYRI